MRHALRVLEAGHHEVAETGQHSGADGQLGNGGGYFVPFVDEGAAPGVYVVVGFLPVSRRLPVGVVCAEERACLLQRPHRLGRGYGKAERLLIGALAVHASQDNNASVLAQQRQQGGLAGEVEQTFVYNGKAFEIRRNVSCPLCTHDAAQHAVRVTKQQEFAAVVLCGFNGGSIGREVRGDVRAAIFHVVEPCQPQPRLVAGAGNQDIVVLRCAKDAHHQVNQSCYARGIRPEDARGIDATQSLETVEGRRRGFSLCRLVVIGRVVEQLIYVGAYEVVHSYKMLIQCVGVFDKNIQNRLLRLKPKGLPPVLTPSL